MAAPTSATHPIPSPGGGAPRSESQIYMIAGGNHTLIHRCRAQARRMRNAGGNLMKGKPYQASSHIQYFAVPLPSFSSLLRRYEKSTLPPGEGICGRSMTAPTNATRLWQYCRAGPWSRRKKAPLCKGGCQPNRLTGGLFCIVPLQSLRHFLTKMPPPFTQGRLSGGR